MPKDIISTLQSIPKFSDLQKEAVVQAANYIAGYDHPYGDILRHFNKVYDYKFNKLNIKPKSENADLYVHAIKNNKSYFYNKLARRHPIFIGDEWQF